MAKTLLNIKVDREVKQNAKKLAENLGLSLSVLVNAQLKQLVQAQRVSFTASYKMSPALEKILRGVETDIKKGRNLSPAFNSKEEMDGYLDSL